MQRICKQRVSHINRTRWPDPLARSVEECLKSLGGSGFARDASIIRRRSTWLASVHCGGFHADLPIACIMTIWHQPPSLEQINRGHDNTAVSQMGIELTAIDDDSLTARMPVDARTKQPAGLLHGGASLLLCQNLKRSPACRSCAPRRARNFSSPLTVSMAVL